MALRLRIVEFTVKKGKEAAAREFDVDKRLNGGRFCHPFLPPQQIRSTLQAPDTILRQLITGVQTDVMASHKSMLSFRNSCGPRTQSS